MVVKTLFTSAEKLDEIVQEFGTPFHLYDERGIRETARRLHAAFPWVKGPDGKGFMNYFAVKALPNPHILDILREEGMGTDCSSDTELLLSKATNITGERIMFTSNNTPAEEFKLARSLGAIINIDDLMHLPFLEEHAGLPDILCFRYNPGPLAEGDNTIFDPPEETKYGHRHDQILEAYQTARDKGVRRFGLHTMIGSNKLNPNYFVRTAGLLFDLVGEVAEKTGVPIELVNIGGGIGIPYQPDQEAVDLDYVSRSIQQAYEEKIKARGLAPLQLVMENGRYVTGPQGILVTQVRHIMQKYKDFIGVDASIEDMKRHALYGAYHHITILGRESEPQEKLYTVVDSLCENNGRFATDRPLPTPTRGDILVVHDTGAHCYAMGGNYNGKRRSSELLLRENGDVTQIRKPETIDHLFATLHHAGVRCVLDSR
ncbi:diaminopimelate decarboxylase [Candidatus Woesearchaeota archaeon]|nr:diaminopimelate decarboxylase [Candidatus Woesearchaeota archaeon]